MPESLPGPGSGSEPRPGPDDADAERGNPGPDPAGHDAEGLDLARSVARALGNLAGRARAAGTGRRTPPGSARRGAARRREAGGSGAHPDDRDPQPLDATIGRLVSEEGWSTEVRVHGVFSRWEQIVGEEVAAHCRPVSFTEGRLGVRTDSTAWATQVRLLAPTVVRRLNEELGEHTVTVVDVQGPAVPSWRRGPRSVRGGRGPRDTYG